MTREAQSPSKKKPAKKGSWIFLAFVGLLYLVVGILNSDKAIEALMSAWDILKMMVLIIVAVFFLMGLFNAFVKPQSIAKHLGDESGKQGWMIALLGGILSHGSSYIWYPMLSNFRDMGAKEGLIVTFFYARSVKIPWIPLMISYFGLLFTTVFYSYIIIAALLQGLIANLFFKAKKRGDKTLNHKEPEA